MDAPVVLIHGYTGSPASWDEVVRRLPAGARVVRPTVGGHDGTAAPTSFEGEVDRIAATLREARLERALLAGYSLGGRLAIGLLARHAELFASALVISANPGLDDPNERDARVAQDETWAALLETEGVSAFVARWEAQPLFATQAKLAATRLEGQRESRLRHDARGLAGAMRALSLGRMPAYAEALSRVPSPITLLTGENDAKFTAIGARLAARLRRGAHVVAPGAGHNVILERPELVAELLTQLGRG